MDREVAWQPALIVADGATVSGDGKPSVRYRLNGMSAAYDDDAHRWFAQFLPKVLMETGVNIAPRITRWRAQGGTGNALSHIERMASTNAKRSHYQALLDARDLPADDVDRIVRSARRSLTSSSSDMRTVLMQAAARRP
jgi:hypothetical protein